MIWKTVTAVSALIAIGAFAPAANAAVVLSDNFNSDHYKLNWGGDTVFASLAIPTPGVKGVSSTDLVGDGTPFAIVAPGNGKYVDLDGSTGPGHNPAGVLSSIKSFKAGVYKLSFDLAGNNRGGVSQTTVVSLGGTTIASLLEAAANPFALHSYTFTSTGGKLVFTENGPSDNVGNLLDNVTLTAIPEPATWAMMLVGFGGLGASLRASRRKLIAV